MLYINCYGLPAPMQKNLLLLGEILYKFWQRKVHWKDHVEGTSGDEVIYYYKYAMIKKEDFYNNRPNYVMIEDMEIDKDSIVS